MKNIISNALLIIGFAAFAFGVCALSQYEHAKHCPGHGKCGWAWCAHYDGSDYLHDFN